MKLNDEVVKDRVYRAFYEKFKDEIANFSLWGLFDLIWFVCEEREKYRDRRA